SRRRPLPHRSHSATTPKPTTLRDAYVLAHPSGITEIEVGTYSVTGDVIELELSTRADGSIGLAPTAKEVTALDRSYRIDGDELSYSLQMRAVGQPLQDHLAAVLHRQR
ncbi:FABP family protein, partial [Mycobacterium canetti]|uniref:FABP family protein n=3 Tax=Mycobacterium canetti TaxID=78331 RepID=UPI001EE47348